MTQPPGNPRPFGPDPYADYKSDSDREQQKSQQSWTFVAPVVAAERDRQADALTETTRRQDAENARIAALPLFEQIPKPDPSTPILKRHQDYPDPHPLAQYLRGVPQGEQLGGDKKTPIMKLPVQAAQATAIHLERAGVVHVDQVKALANEHGWIHINQLPVPVVKYHAPKHGPDHPENPGTWHHVDEPDTSPPSHAATPPDLTALSHQQLAALELALAQEKIRKAKISHADFEVRAVHEQADLDRAHEIAATADYAETAAAQDPDPNSVSLHSVVADLSVQRVHQHLAAKDHAAATIAVSAQQPSPGSQMTMEQMRRRVESLLGKPAPPLPTDTESYVPRVPDSVARRLRDLQLLREQEAADATRSGPPGPPEDVAP